MTKTESYSVEVSFNIASLSKIDPQEIMVLIQNLVEYKLKDALNSRNMSTSVPSVMLRLTNE